MILAFSRKLIKDILIGQKTKHSPFCRENKIVSKNDFKKFLKKIKPKTIYDIKNFIVIGLIRSV